MEHHERTTKNHSGPYVFALIIGLCLAIYSIWSLIEEKRQTVEVQRPQTTHVLSTSGEELKGEKNDDAESSENQVPVYLVGAVKKPGIYYVNRGSYLYELVEMAGGLTPDAAKDQVNLASSIDHNQMIRILTQEEVDAGYRPAIISSNSEAEPLVDLNRADQDELETLPGIGPVTAQAILDYRNNEGPFRTIDEIMNVPGIKQARFEALKDWITVGGVP